ncbi:MAG: hypothetical protein GC136_00160 [Alphaproteobacteria bacterium]|nr:hypothetical protein [Alphaproteobacteria bacterium]
MGGVNTAVNAATNLLTDNMIARTLGSAMGFANTLSAYRNLAGAFMSGGQTADDVARQFEAREAQLKIKNAQDSAALAKEKLALEQEQARVNRLDKLRRAVARQQVMFGAQGISTEGGSAEAVLRGLSDAADLEAVQDAQRAEIQRRSYDLDMSQTISANLLKRQELLEKNNLRKATKWSF